MTLTQIDTNGWDEYIPFVALTDETLDEMAAEMDREELADLSQQINKYIALSHRGDASHEELREQFRKVQHDLYMVAVGMNFVKWSLDQYEKLKAKQQAS